MHLLIPLLGLLLIFAIVWWAIQQLNLPQPVRMIAVVIFAIVAIYELLPLIGSR